MSPDLYHELLDLLKPGITKQTTNWREPIKPEARLALTMRFLALGDGFYSLAQQFRVGESTSREMVKETCRAIIRILGKTYMPMPKNAAEWKAIADEYERRWNFPHCVGTLDGKHIRISQPKNSGSFFRNYKDFFSVVLLAIAGPSYQFIYVDIGSEGKASDGGIWKSSSFYDKLHKQGNPLKIPAPSTIEGIDEPVPYYLLSDDAFALGPHLLKPYPSIGLTKKQRLFNYRLSRSRRVIENVFGILTCRFRIYRRTIECNPDFVTLIVMATCILHNFLRQRGQADYTPPGSFDEEDDAGNVIPGRWREEVPIDSLPKDKRKNAAEYAKNLRNSLANYFNTKHGSVPWQYSKI